MKKIKDPALFEKIRQFLTEYMPIIKRESTNTVIAYRYTLNLYLVFLQNLLSEGLNSITSADFNQKNILAFMDWLRSYRGNKISTANLRLVHLRRFCRFLMEENILLLSELSAIQKIEEFPKEYANGIKYLTVPEMKLVLAQPDPNKNIGLRDRFFMYLLYDSGCRIQEILDFTIRDFSVNSSGARLHIIGKGNKFRATPISEELIPMYEEYCVHFHKKRNLDDYLFYTKRSGITAKMSCDNAQRFISKYGAKAKNVMPTIPHLHPHLFRHTRAMHLYMAGMPLEMVAQWLGHSQMETSLIYANATTEMKLAAVKKISLKENSVFKDDEKFKYIDNDELIKRLYGLI